MAKEIVTETSRTKRLSGKAKTRSIGIQVEACPAPKCNLSQKDVKLFLNEMIPGGGNGLMAE